MNYDELVKKISLLEYQQQLLLKMMPDSKASFYKLVIEKSLTRTEVETFYKTCEKLSIDLEEQKAEGFVYFHPLFQEFKHNLHKSLKVEEVISACLFQGLYLPLMTELKKYLPI